MNKIFKLILWILLCVLLGTAIYVGYYYLTSTNDLSVLGHNSVEESLNLFKDNYENKTKVANVKYDNIDIMIKKDINDNINVSGELNGTELNMYYIEKQLYTCVNNFCIEADASLIDNYSNQIEQIDNLNKYLEYGQYFYETKLNGDQVLEVSDYGTITIANDGSELNFESNGNLTIDMTFEENIIEKP